MEDEPMRRETRGRPRIDPEGQTVKMGVALLPRQEERLKSCAKARNVSVSTIVRGLVEEWERSEGLIENP
jgi:hypothetical protein